MKHAKKITAVLLVFALALSLAACGGQVQSKQADNAGEEGSQIEGINNPEETTEPVEAVEPEAAEQEVASEGEPAESESQVAEDAAQSDSQEKPADNTNNSGSGKTSSAPMQAGFIDHKASDNGEQTASSTKVLATSKDANLYVLKNSDGSSYVVNNLGVREFGYDIDANGSIVDEDGDVTVMAKNVERFIPIRRLSFNKPSYDVILHAQEDTVGGNEYITRINQYVTTVTVYLNVSPSDATNGVILVRPADTSVAEIRKNTNKNILAEGDFELENGEIAIKAPDPTRPVEIIVSMRRTGSVKIFAEAYSSPATAECYVTVKNGAVDSLPVPTEPPTEYLNASAEPENHYHVHSYSATVVPPTYEEQGYTVYTCNECGYSYTDNYVAKLAAPEPVEPPHMHSYVDTVVPPTETEQGYTQHVCSCGDSYIDSFIPPLAP